MQSFIKNCIVAIFFIFNSFAAHSYATSALCIKVFSGRPRSEELFVPKFIKNDQELIVFTIKLPHYSAQLI